MAIVVTLTVGLLVVNCGGSTSRAPSGGTPTDGSSPSSAAAAPTGSGVGYAGTWPTYHADQSRTGAVPAGSSGHAVKVWTSDLAGVVHGQPVVADGRIFAATENNRVVALDPGDGRVEWSVSLGDPLTDVDAVAGCGNIDPLGITSTPVVDTGSHVVYVVGEVKDNDEGGVHHQLEGLDTTTGKVVLSENVDPPLPAGERAVNLLQRTSLALANGRVYVGYGGNIGDCGRYHGWLVGVNETGPAHLVTFEVASDGEGGAIWQSGGAPAVDSAGDIYVTTGNANPDPPQGGPDPKAYTESVVKLTPELKPLASFKDRVAGGDEDLSTGNPVLLSGGRLFAVGKTDIGFVLRQSDLTQISTISGVCGSDPDGGPAYDKATDRVFVPCRNGGIQEIDLASHSLGPRLSGSNSGPILIGNRLWAAQYPQGTLTQYDAATGTTLQTTQVGGAVANFTTPSAGLGLILVPTNSGVTAYR